MSLTKVADYMLTPVEMTVDTCLIFRKILKDDLGFVGDIYAGAIEAMYLPLIPVLATGNSDLWIILGSVVFSYEIADGIRNEIVTPDYENMIGEKNEFLDLPSYDNINLRKC